jgi:hypothetical protein
MVTNLIRGESLEGFILLIAFSIFSPFVIVLVILKVLNKLKYMEYILVFLQVSCTIPMFIRGLIMDEDNPTFHFIWYVALVYMGTSYSKMVQNTLPRVSRFTMPMFLISVPLSSIHHFIGFHKLKDNLWLVPGIVSFLVFIKALDFIDQKLQEAKKDHEKNILTNL